MIVRNIDDPIVIRTAYIAHGGGVARMVMDSSFLKSMEFFAHALLPPGNKLEEHIDPYEEIYFILKGRGLMRVGNDEREIKEGDAVWIPAGDIHSLKNTGKEDAAIIVIAAYPVR